LLNETYGSGAEAAYSTRRLNGNVTECMVIRRASDSTTQTIGFDGSGNIDEAAIETFCTGTTCTVYQWLDQSGNGNTATAPSTGEEPTIYTGGALVKDGGRLALNFNNDRLRAEITATITSESVFVTTTIDNSGRWNRIVSQAGTSGGDTGSYIPMIQQDNLGVLGGFDGSFRAGVAFNYSTQLLFSAINTGTSLTNYVSGTAGTASVYSLTETIGTLGIGDAPNGGNSNETLVGNMQEVVVYHSDKSGTDQTSIEENIGDYFTQNTPLLDTYTGAAAAYSLRRLSSSYVGSAVEVYNGSSYADIGFDVFGGLNTVALAAHCGYNSGYVSKWYSQTGSNDATQTNTARMPKIYDGTTGVVTENGKPAVEFDGTSSTMSAPASLTNAVTIFVVYRRDTTIGNYILDGRNSTRLAVGGVTSGSEFQVYVSSGLGGLNDILSQQNLGYVLANATNSAVALNGGTAITGSSGNAVNTSEIWIGSRLGGSGFMQGKQQEVIYFDADKSSNRANIEDNINTFYSIY